MAEAQVKKVQEFKLDPDTELRFEVESKNEHVTLTVCFIEKHQYILILYIFYCILAKIWFCRVVWNRVSYRKEV